MQQRIALLLTIVLFQSAHASHIHQFGLGGRPVLCVPERDLDSHLLRYNDESLHLVVGHGRTPGFGFLLDPQSITKLAAKFRENPRFRTHPYANKLAGTVSFVSTEDSRRFGPSMRAQEIEDLWYSNDKCHQPVVDTIAGSELFAIRCSPDDRYSSIWKRIPDRQLPMPNPNEFVVANCRREKFDFGIFAGSEIDMCSRIQITGTLMIDYRIQIENADLIPTIDLVLISKINEWKNNCLSSRMQTRITSADRVVKFLSS